MEKAPRSSPNSTPFCGVASTSSSLQSDWMAFNSGTGTSSSQFFRLNSNVALMWLSNSWFIWLKSNEMYVPPDRGEFDLSHLLSKLRFCAILLQPRIDVRTPAKILVIIINHAYSGDRRGRGDSQVLHFEEQWHLVGYSDTIIIYQRQYLKMRSFRNVLVSLMQFQFKENREVSSKGWTKYTLLSSMTLFMFSIQSASTGPSKRIHFSSAVSSVKRTLNFTIVYFWDTNHVSEISFRPNNIAYILSSSRFYLLFVIYKYNTNLARTNNIFILFN